MTDFWKMVSFKRSVLKSSYFELSTYCQNEAAMCIREPYLCDLLIRSKFWEIGDCSIGYCSANLKKQTLSDLKNVFCVPTAKSGEESK